VDGNGNGVDDLPFDPLDTLEAVTGAAELLALQNSAGFLTYMNPEKDEEPAGQVLHGEVGLNVRLSRALRRRGLPLLSAVPRKQYRGFESPLSTLGKPRIVYRDPVREAGSSRLSGDFGGKSVANATASQQQQTDLDGQTTSERCPRVIPEPRALLSAPRESRYHPRATQVVRSFKMTPVPERSDLMPTEEQALPSDPLVPVSHAKDGFTPSEARDLLGRYNYMEVLGSGDVTLFFSLNVNQSLVTATIPRAGSVVMLEKDLDPSVGQTRIKGVLGDLSLAEFLVHPGSRAQGMIVVRRGRIVFEEYPGMREFDYKTWMSNTKTAASLIIALLEEEGKIDVNQPIESYVHELCDTEWAGTRVLDILDMASGMDVLETQEYRLNPRSIIARFNFAANGAPNADGKVETQLDVIRSAKRVKPAGQAFDYSSVNTLMLVFLAEAVENRRWYEIFRERVWSKMTVEGDALMGLSPDGVSQAEGMMISRLRDMARYGMLYTPSWHLAAREKIVSDEYIRKIQTGGRKSIFLEGEFGRRLVEKYFPMSPPVANHWQWDAVWADGDMYKSGTFGQGIYASPGKDLVIGFMSTVLFTDLTQYARATAMAS
jgi:CubicO group peptidase (beta-lactamase class C family)